MPQTHYSVNENMEIHEIIKSDPKWFKKVAQRNCGRETPRMMICFGSCCAKNHWCVLQRIKAGYDMHVLVLATRKLLATEWAHVKHYGLNTTK